MELAPPPAQGAPLGRILSVTIYPPNEKPVKFTEGEVAAAGLQDGVTICAVVNKENGELTQFFGLPMKVVKAAPTGLVAPGRSGGLIVPPT